MPAASERPAGAPRGPASPPLPHTWRPMGAGFAVIGWALGRARVTAEQASLVVVNGFRTRRLEWEQVLGVHLPAGAPWATLDLADGTTISAMAFQGSDGKMARDGVRQLRALIDRDGSGHP